MAKLARLLPTLAAVTVLTVLPGALAHGLVGGLNPVQAAQPGADDAAFTFVPLDFGQGTPSPQGRDPVGLLPSLPWESANAVASGPGLGWKPLLLAGQPASGAPVRGSVEFWCPGVDGGTSINDGTNTMTLRGACPFRIIDDADLMGSPQVAINPNDPNAVVFFSLHGAGTEQGPSPRSRDPSPEGTTSLTGQSHTTFTSQDHGRSWYDNPWGTDGFGEHVSGVMDADGNLYIAALWSKRLGDGEFDYVIKLYKEQDGRFEISNYSPSKTYANRAAGNEIVQSNLVYVPAQSFFPVVENMTGNQTGNATGPADPSQIGNYTNPDSPGTGNSADDRVMLVWHERARDWRNATTGKSSWIDAAWTDTTSRDNWTRLTDTQLIGPCMSASNPVNYNGKAYVSCVVDDGYNARSRARIGDIDVWSIDPMTGDTKLEGVTRLQGGQPRMTGRPDGFMAITATEVRSESEVEVEMAWGWYGGHWQTSGDMGPILHSLASNTMTSNMPQGVPQPPPAGNSVRDARITAMALVDSDTLFLVYMERIVPLEQGDPNPANPFVSPDSAIEYKKLIATFTPCTGPDNVFDLQLGVARHPFPEAIVRDTGVFDDLQDGMQTWTDPVDGSQRVYFAYGDHGVVQYGALLPASSQPLSAVTCSNPPPPPFIPAQVIPAGLGASSPYTTLIGSTVGVAATAMVGFLLTVKRKSANALAAKAKK